MSPSFIIFPSLSCFDPSPKTPSNQHADTFYDLIASRLHHGMGQLDQLTSSTIFLADAWVVDPGKEKRPGHLPQYPHQVMIFTGRSPQLST